LSEVPTRCWKFQSIGTFYTGSEVLADLIADMIFQEFSDMPIHSH
jgi:hypothetical protein